MRNIDELVATLAKDGATVKPALHPYALCALWMAGAIVYLALSLLYSGLRPDLMQKFHEPWFVAEIAALLGIFATTSLSAAILAFPDLHQMRRVVFLPVLMFALFILTIFLSWHADSPPAPLPEHSFECTLDISLFALLPAVWIFYSMRKFASIHYQWAGSIALLSAFSIGALWLRLHEQNDSILHLIQWHYLPMVVCGVLGLWLGKVVLKW